jgi:MFS family permease
MWVVASIMLGLGLTFFSGATEAWLVDSLNYADFKGNLDTVFGRAQSVSGVAMLTGSVAGGLVAQASNLGVPYWLRIGLLLATLVVAAIYMHDWGFTPERGASISADIRQLFKTSIDLGLRKRRVRWVMLAAPFASGVGIYIFYAMQPHLLNLYGDQGAYGVAGLAAAIVAGAQIVGGILGPTLRKRVARRTSALLIGAVLSAAMLLLISQVATFWLAIVVLSAWGLIFAAVMPIRQAYLNGLIPSKQRATVLSFDALMGSSGGAVFQPILGRAADAGGYPFSFMVGGLIQALAIPLLGLAHGENLRHPSDEAEEAA